MVAGLGMVCIGLYITAYGPALPFLASDFDVSLDTTGLLITFIFGGSITASLCTSIWWHGHDARLLMLYGALGLGAGLAVMALAPNWPMALVGDGLAGVGDGLLVGAAHMAVANAVSDVAKGYIRLNIWFAIGAMLGPLWSGLLLNANPDARPVIFAGLAVLPLLVGIALLFVESPPVQAPVPPSSAQSRGMTPMFWVMGAVLWLYVGAEIGLGGWVSSYTAEAFGSGVVAGAVVTSGYWGALLLGRMACSRALSANRTPRAILLVSLVGATAASAALALITGSVVLGAAAAFTSGFFLGPIWPSVSSIATGEGTGAGTPAAVVTIGNAGGLFLPWLQGRVLAGAGAQRGIGVTALLCATMLAIVAGSRLVTRLQGRRR